MLTEPLQHSVCPIATSPQQLKLGQLTGKDSRWHDYDLWAGRPIDVKNVTVYRGNNRQNFIPKFKRSEGRDVTICAFATRADHNDQINQYFLGEVSQPELGSSLAAVQREFPESVSIQVRFDDQYLPAWVFEYPFGKIDYDEILQAFKLFADDPGSILAASIAAGKSERTGTYTRLTSRQRQVVDAFSRVIQGSSYSKRTFVLFAVAGFTSEILTQGKPQWFVRFFRRLLQMEVLGTKNKFGAGSRRCPNFPDSQTGGLPDPLGSVSAMLDLLEEAAKEIEDSGLMFQAFDTPSPHVLMGRLDNNRKITIYAYCGGRSEKGLPCDTFPLVLGKNKTCTSCGKLVCHECGFCSAVC